MIGNNENGRRSWCTRCALMSSATLAIGTLIASPAPAQETQPQDGEAAADQGLIVITGSRIKRDGFEDRVPATVMSAQAIQNLGRVNVGEVLTLIPQNAAFQSDTNAGPGVGSRASSNIGATYANLRGLNPFYGTRTLTLVDSRRFVPTSDSGAVDVNLIPSTLISRVETVTGGASAAYGSDAIAGVVNIILDRRFQGLKGQIDGGITERGDGETYHAALAAGTGFGGGRGHIVLSAEYQKNEEVGGCSRVRDWCADSWDVFLNSNVIVGGVTSGFNRPGTPTYGQPNYVIGRDSKLAYTTRTSVIRNAAPAAPAARNMMWNEDGTALVPFDAGLYSQASALGPRSGGDGASVYEEAYLRTPIERFALFGAASYDLTDTTELTLEASYGGRKARAMAITSGPTSTMQFRPDNAFLTPAVRALVGSNNFTVGTDVDDQVTNMNMADAKTFRAVLGVNGELGLGNWTWDAYYQYGRNTRFQSLSHVRVNSFFSFGIDAVIDPSTGDPICRAKLQGNPDAADCVPINLFGASNLSQEAIDYAWREAIEDFKYDQHVVAASIQGALFDGVGAGPFSAALGVEHRSDKGDVTHGDVPYYDQFGGSFGLDYAGKIRVTEGFLELNTPLLRNVPMGKFLELNGAIRHTATKSTDSLTDDSRSVGMTSWKLGGVYEPIEGLRFRATRSRDIRAAGFRELFEQQIPTDPSTTRGRVSNPFNSNAADATPILSGGNFALTPEKANTWTVGAVVSPTRNLRFSVDWFAIKITDAVTTPAGQQLVDTCFNLDVFCDRITFNPNVANRADITFVDARQINVGSFTSRGLDIELDYTTEFGSDSRVSFRLLGTYLYDMVIQAAPGSTPVNFAGQSGPAAPLGDFNPSPKLILNGTVTYDQGPFTGTLQGRYIGKGALNKTFIGPDDPDYDPTLPNSINDNTVASRFYLTLGLNVRLLSGDNGRQLEWFGTVDNLLDTDPPIAPGSTASVVQSSYPTNPAFFDTLGRRYRTGIRVRY
ncbi:TonB-dependent receptor domain-containing protein [Sphingobium lignivorans]|uniref:Outer membrane receptor protein involved in Fe transport n=1 Tax=Sphingobium lignivorans TaxID=2735886 RepID=A0ABR6NLG0_9SPHN|nr:TonB-dependent receptor [Sphingobium lignivorans]MBB5987532.1 outer membrane receptor protein involved in Fe transport [Sphingobium lignivorans]